MPPKIKALLTALTLLAGALISVLKAFHVVHWSAAQTTLVSTEAAALLAFAAALIAHFWPGTKQQAVALSGTVTALVAATLALGPGFAWWKLTGAENSAIIGLASAVVAVASALTARTQVTAQITPPRGLGAKRDTNIMTQVDEAVKALTAVRNLIQKNPAAG
jgi:hypothetical protein